MSPKEMQRQIWSFVIDTSYARSNGMSVPAARALKRSDLEKVLPKECLISLHMNWNDGTKLLGDLTDDDLDGIIRLITNN
jgi:hypothetical protein